MNAGLTHCAGPGINRVFIFCHKDGILRANRFTIVTGYTKIVDFKLGMHTYKDSKNPDT